MGRAGRLDVRWVGQGGIQSGIADGKNLEFFLRFLLPFLLQMNLHAIGMKFHAVDVTIHRGGWSTPVTRVVDASSWDAEHGTGDRRRFHATRDPSFIHDRCPPLFPSSSR